MRAASALALSLAAFFAVAVAAACPGEKHLSHEVLGWWSADPLVIGLLAVTTVAYVVGTRSLWRVAGRGHGIRPWHAAAFAGGQLVVAAALLSPLDRLSDILFSAHMSQ